MTHPTHPLAIQERAAIIAAPNDPEAIATIQREFAKRRDLEFPGWAIQYEAEVKAWIAWHSKPRRA